MHSDTFKHGPANSSFRYLHNINQGDIWRLIFNITQSVVDFAINDRFQISAFGIRMPNGQGKAKVTVINRVKSKSIIQIINYNSDVNDVRNKMCLPRAIKVCKFGKYCVKHPKIFIGDEYFELTGENYEISNINGLIKCIILPPRQLFLSYL